MAKFFKEKIAEGDLKNFSLGFVDEENQNCMHYAIGKNRYAFVEFLIE